MDTQKLHDLIDKVIGKKGPLRVPAYWMKKVLHSITKHTDDSVNSLRTELNTNIGSKLDSVIYMTYKEFYEMHRAGKGIEGQCYCITDYKPTVSRHQSDDVYIRSNDIEIEIKIYINYSKSYFIEHFDRLEDVKSFHAVMRTYDGALKTEEFNIVYNMHDSYVNRSTDYKWVPDNEECFDTIKVSITYGDLKSLELKYKHCITEGSYSYHIYEDVNTGKEYKLLSVKYEGKLKIRLGIVGGGTYEPEDLRVEDYSFRTFGFITKMIDVVRGNDFCFDAYNITFSSAFIYAHFIDSTIVGYRNGLLPKIYIDNYTSKRVFISNSDSIYLNVGYNDTLVNTTIINSTNIKLKNCINSFFCNCINIENNNIVNCNFYVCSDIKDSSPYSGILESSTFYISNGISVSEVHDSYIQASGSESNPTSLGWLEHAVVHTESGATEVGKLACISNDGILKEASSVGTTRIIYPKTTTTSVTDEASGKTMDVIIQELQDRITALEGA